MSSGDELNNLEQPLNPGIVELVRLLNANGLETCDSGDGVTHDHSCDRDYAYVVIRSTKASLIDDADFIKELMARYGVDIVPLTMDMNSPGMQATYNPADGICLIDLTGVTDKTLIEG